MYRKLLFTLAAVAGLGITATTPLPVMADGIYAPVNSYAYVPAEVGRYRVRGWVTAYDRFNLTLRANGRMVPVNLHQGTVILPTGLTLQRGMFVSVDGYWNNVGFHAERIVLVR